MEIDEFKWLMAELSLLKNEYKYLETIYGTYDAHHFCYIVCFNCNFCGEFFTIPVSIAEDYVIDMRTIENIKSAFLYYYNSYEKYFT